MVFTDALCKFTISYDSMVFKKAIDTPKISRKLIPVT